MSRPAPISLLWPWTCKTCNKPIDIRHRECNSAMKEERRELHLSSKSHEQNLPWTCTTCQKTFKPRDQISHLSSKKHAKKLPWTCMTCNETFTVGGQMSHLSSKGHARKLPWTCTICDETITMESQKLHISSKGHCERLRSKSHVPDSRADTTKGYPERKAPENHQQQPQEKNTKTRKAMETHTPVVAPPPPEIIETSEVESTCLACGFSMATRLRESHHCNKLHQLEPETRHQEKVCEVLTL